MKVFDWIINKIKSYDKFGSSVPPFNLAGKTSASTFIGGIISLFIKYISYAYILMRLNQMIFFADYSMS